MFNLFNRRPQLSKKEATQVAEAILPLYLANYPGLFPFEYATLLYKSTEKYKNCWVFYWNSKRYAETNDFQDQWVGPGPILIDKWTGYVRIYPSGHGLQEILDEYDADEVAAGHAWVKSILFQPSEKATVLSRLKSEFGLSLQEIAALKERLPGPLFAGRMSSLVWLMAKLREAGIPCEVGIDAPETAAKLEWVHFSWKNMSPAEALKNSRDYPQPHGGWLYFREYNCPITEIVSRYGTPPKRAFQRNGAEEKTILNDMFEQAVLSGHAKALNGLLPMRLDLNRPIPNTNGDTALLLAVRSGNTEMVQVLLTYSAKIEIPDAEGRTALELAAEKGLTEIASLLQKSKDKGF